MNKFALVLLVVIALLTLGLTLICIDSTTPAGIGLLVMGGVGFMFAPMIADLLRT